MKIRDDVYVFWIVKNSETCTYDVWLHEENIGVAIFCFGVSVDDFTITHVKNIVQDNCFLYIGQYIVAYT